MPKFYCGDHESKKSYSRKFGSCSFSLRNLDLKRRARPITDIRAIEGQLLLVIGGAIGGQ